MTLPTKTIHILLVDDDVTFVDTLKAHLLNHYSNLQIEALTIPEKMIEQLMSYELNIDVIVCNYKLKSTNGLLLLQKIRENGMITPFIMFTGKTEEDIAIRALNLGADYYLHKQDLSFMSKELYTYITRAADKKRLNEELKIKDYAIQSAINAIAIADRQGRLTYVNSSFLTLWGYKEDESEKVLGRKLTEFWYDVEKAEELILSLFVKESWIGELLGRKRDQTLFMALLSASYVRNEKNEPICLMVSFIDVTQTKELERLLADIVKTTFDAIIVIDTDGNIMFGNDSLIQLCGYSKFEIIGMKFDRIAVTHNFVKLLIKSAQNNHQIINLTTSLLPKYGAPIPVRLSSRLIKEWNKNQILIILSDMRIEKETPEELIMFYKSMFEKVKISLFKMSFEVGPTLVMTEELNFNDMPGSDNEILTLIGVYYATAIGQGNSAKIGLYGPLPIPKQSEYVSLVYAFVGYDPYDRDPRGLGKTYCFFVLSIPEGLITMSTFSNRRAIEQSFEEAVSNIKSLNDITFETLRKIKREMLEMNGTV